MSRKTNILLIAVVLIVLVVICSIILVNFYAPGIHFLGSAFHAQEARTCYLLDGINGVIGQSQLAIDGTAFGRFHGYINVEEYSFPMYTATQVNASNGTSGFHVQSNGNYIEVYYNALPAPSDVSSTYNYILTLDRSTPEQIIIFVMKGEMPVAVAVAANSAEEAKTIYENYLKDRNNE